MVTDFAPGPRGGLRSPDGATVFGRVIREGHRPSDGPFPDYITRPCSAAPFRWDSRHGSARDEAGRYPGRATYQLWTGREFGNGEGTWIDDPSRAARARRRGDRM